MTSLCRHLSPTSVARSTAQEIVNWVTTVDGYVHSSQRRRDGIGGVFWALVNLSEELVDVDRLFGFLSTA